MAKTKHDPIDDVILIDKTLQKAERSPDYQSVYSNNIHLSVSLFDFSLVFGEITDDRSDNGMNVVNQKVRVVLSKEMTKVLWRLLDRNLAAYEKQYGQINIPVRVDNEEN